MDQFQGHEHLYLKNQYEKKLNLRDAEAYLRYPSNTKTGGIVSDDKNGTPRYGEETRVKNISIKLWKRIS